MYKIGLALGLSSGILWAMNTLFLSKIIISISLVQEKVLFFAIPLLISFSHDFFSSIFLFLNLKIKKCSFRIPTKTLIILIFSSILGGPIGMGSYLIGAKLIGSSYSATISVLYPLIGLVLDKIFLKVKMTKYKTMGIILGVSSVMLISFSKTEENYENFYLGIIFSIICAFSWAIEGIIASYAMKNEEISSDVAISLRQISSTIFYFLFIIPFINSGIIIKNIINLKLFYLLIIAAFIGSISYLFWYKAIDFIGASVAMTLNISYILWIVLFEFLFLEKTFEINFLFSLIFMLSAIFLITKGEG